MKVQIKLLLLTLLLSVNTGMAYCSPITGPVLGSISSNFGFRIDPFTGVTRSHDGIDIAAPYGAPIFAMQDGYITRSGWRGGYGMAVTIDHYYPDIPAMPRIQTTYGHCSYLYAQVGQYVRRGQVIGLVGSTGRSTGPHLHFEVTYKGRSYPPIDYLMKLPGYVDYITKARQYPRYTAVSSYGKMVNYR